MHIYIHFFIIVTCLYEAEATSVRVYTVFSFFGLTKVKTKQENTRTDVAPQEFSAASFLRWQNVDNLNLEAESFL